MAIVVVGIYFLVAAQAILLALQDYLLRGHHAHGMVKLLPSLEVTEGRLFQLLLIGFIALSLIMMSGLWFYQGAHRLLTWQHVLLAALAWLVFATLLLGHRLFGWRGQTAIRWTLSGWVLLLLSYLASQLLL
jgi:ABC-type uncharacterized transport system permease subunit